MNTIVVNTHDTDKTEKEKMWSTLKETPEERRVREVWEMYNNLQHYISDDAIDLLAKEICKGIDKDVLDTVMGEMYKNKS